MGSPRLTFITGTGTGVGKTVLTGLLLAHLRGLKRNTLAIKPFCSGGRSDARLLQGLQDKTLSLEEINPFYFDEPVAPLVAARKHNRRIPLAVVQAHVRRIQRRCDWLLVEGAGGLLVPLGKGYSVLDLIVALKAWVIVAAPNRLGTLNHTLLTLKALRAASVRRITVALIDTRVADHASISNLKILRELAAPTSVVHLPFLGPRASSQHVIRRQHARLTRALRQLLQ